MIYIDIINCFKYISYYNICDIYTAICCFPLHSMQIPKSEKWAGGVLPPVNPNGFRRPGCAGVRRSNFRSGQVLISIVKIWSKTCTSRQSIFVFSENGICCTFFWRIKRFECDNFRFEVPCSRIDDRK
jgi:hypothetical protein